MKIRVRFYDGLVRKPSGWLPGGIGGVFPAEYAELISPATLVLTITACMIEGGYAWFHFEEKKVRVSCPISFIRSIIIPADLTA